jgi:carbon storage regulator
LLVLSRKNNQSILIRGKEGEIRVVVVESEKGKIRLGIEAPKGYLILREEVVTEIRQANRQSAIESIESISSYMDGKRE